MESSQLSDLSCTACKTRKVRCNRVKPRCGRCETRGLDCCYPKRVKRQGTREKRRSSRANNTINTILSSADSTTPYSHDDSDHSPMSTSSIARVDPLNILEDAIVQIRRCKLQFFCKQTIVGTIDIPTEMAKQWIHNYFVRNSNDLFRSLVNRRLIETIPDIIDLPHVHLDPVALVLYFAILYIGCLFNANNLHAIQVSQYATSCYLACLRALPSWQREMQGSMMDFVAGLFMAQVASLCFDDELAWRMHQRTCEFARALNLHNLDGGDYAGFRDEAQSDEDRKGFWQLIQIDLGIRLVLNKPLEITADTWKVNLPWLSSSQPPPGDILAMAFITHSRMTLIVMRFFSLIDSKAISGVGELQHHTEYLCNEIKNLLLDWQAEDWPVEAPANANKGDEFAKSDVVITGYAYIILMFREVGVIKPHLTNSSAETSQFPTSLVLEASRRVIEISINLLHMFPYPEGLLMVLVYYRIYIATALLYSHVFHSTGDHAIVEDMQRLRDLSKCVCSITGGSRELAPIGRATEILNKMMTEHSVAT